jgi:eukaryotic-like serine/threonine-protein kinase
MKDSEERLREIFLAALELSGEARVQYLSDACGGEHDLLEKVETLLAAHHDSTGILNTGADLEAATLGDELSEGPGTSIGRYKILQLIGEGGMGVVYMAEQTQPVVRKVALKIIKLGMDTKQVVARFEAERQALALMDHPNIAKVLDASATDSGRPYFVMELVKGVSITDYCDKNKLSTHQRLELFVPVCQSIQHAHQKGIIHRDIKPSNVMVTLHDGKPVPKVIDFGIAKATNQRLTEKTLFTHYAQMIGTPAYMSPEQAEMSGLDVDTRTDVYSLGVLLYELLTGTTPFSSKELMSLGYGEMQRIIAEEDPPKPSTRLSTLMGAEQTVIAGRRNISADKLPKQIAGDLDWIVMKSMEKDRVRRYDTVSGLIADLHRYLNDEPVDAVAPTFAYQFSKFYRKHGRMLKTLAAALALLAVATGVSSWQAVKAIRAERRLEGERDRAVEAESRATEERAKVVALSVDQEKSLYFSHISLAHRELIANRPVHAQALLGKCPEHLRNWEWFYLWRQTEVPGMETLDYHSPVISIAFSPNGRELAAVCADGSLVIRDRSNRAERRFTVREGDSEQIRYATRWQLVRWVAYSPDGEQVAVVAGNNEVKLLSATTGELLRTFSGHQALIHFLTFSPDGNQLATAGFDPSIRVWDAKNGDLKHVSKVDSMPICLSYVLQGEQLVSGHLGRSDNLRFWDPSTGQELRSQSLHRGGVLGMDYHEPSQLLATSSYDTTLRLTDLTKSKSTVMHGHVESGLGVCLSPNGSRLVSMADDQSLRVWDPRTGREILTFRSFMEHPFEVLFEPEGDRILAVDHSNRVVVLDGAPLKESADSDSSYESQGGMSVLDVEYSPMSGALLAVGDGGIVEIWDRGESGDPYLLKFGADTVFDGAFSFDGRHVVTVSGHLTYNEIRVWEAEAPYRALAVFPMDVQPPAVTFDRSGKYVVVGGANGDLYAFDWAESRRLTVVGSHDSSVTGISASQDGKWIASSGLDGTVRIWGGDPRQQLSRGEVVFDRGRTYFWAGFSPDSSRLAVGDRIGGIVVIDAASGDTVLTIPKAHGDNIRRVVFSPNGNYLASASADQTVRVWASGTGKPIGVLMGHRSRVNSVCFSADGRSLASGDGAGILRFWSPAYLANQNEQSISQP